MIGYLIPGILSLLVFGAHCLRTGLMPGVVASLALVALLFVRRPWARVTVQSALALSVIEWFRATLQFVSERRAFGQPWGRLVVIMTAVMLVTLVAVWALGRPAVRERFRGGPRG